MPIKPPAMPPTAAPAAAPLSAAISGPAAINGPTPGMASAPMPASKPSVPPTTPPAPTPAIAPSGAFVLCSWAKSFVPRLSGNKTETSPDGTPRCCSSSTMRSAWICVSTMAITDFFMVFVSLLADFQLTIDFAAVPGCSPCRSLDRAAFGLGLHRAAQRDLAVDGDDFDVLGGERERLVLHQILADLLRDVAIRGARPLIHRRQIGAVSIALVDA